MLKTILFIFCIVKVIQTKKETNKYINEIKAYEKTHYASWTGNDPLKFDDIFIDPESKCH